MYTSTDATDVSRQARLDGLVVPPYAVVHVTGYQLALAHQGQEGFRVWVTESEGVVHEQYLVPLIGMRLAQGEPSHQTEPSGPTPSLGEVGPANRLAEDLAQALGCPVEVSYLRDSREVVAVARPSLGREVRVTLPVSPIALPLMDNPFAAMRYSLLRQLRYQMSQKPDDG